MKTIQNTFSILGLFVAIFVLGAGGAKAQILTSPDFTGTFTLPVQAEWGSMTLPAGKYTLKYGLLDGGADVMEIAGEAKGSPRGTIMVVPTNQTMATKNSLVCVRDGNTLVVRKIELSAIGESFNSAMPRGATLVAQRQSHGEFTLAEGPSLIQRIPVTLSGK